MWAVGLVRDEADIIEAAITHLLTQGVDHVLVADNLSTDGTTDILRALTQRDSRVHVIHDRERDFHQASKATHLARLAARAGADWIVPFDADEFWFAERGGLAAYLRAQVANTVHAKVFNAVPLDADVKVKRDSLMLVEESAQALGKVAVRSHPWLRLQRGNHDVRRVGPVAEGLVVLHLPYRGPTQLLRKHAPDALVDRLASAAPDQALQYRGVLGIDARESAELWAQLLTGARLPQLNWAPAPMGVPQRPLLLSSWLEETSPGPNSTSPTPHQE